MVAKALATKRPFVKFTGMIDEAVTVERGRTVTFLADPNALLTSGSGGAILTVRDDNTSLTVYDLAISNAPNNANGFGLVIQAGGAPSVSLVHTTLDNNPGGGISAAGGSPSASRRSRTIRAAASWPRAARSSSTGRPSTTIEAVASQQAVGALRSTSRTRLFFETAMIVPACSVV